IQGDISSTESCSNLFNKINALSQRIINPQNGKLPSYVFFHVSAYTGTAIPREGQLNLKWAKVQDLNPEDFPIANRSIFDLLLNW
ncbi:MAG: hypothetical protein ACHP6H_07610, partial [Legionellales bacterium]